MNSNVAVLGGALGDEAKGRIAHTFSPQFDWVIRHGGGGNAGHTIYIDGTKYVFNQVPSIDFRAPHIRGFLGSGMVINLETLRDELAQLEQSFPNAASKITVDPDAFVVLPKHIQEDKDTNGHLGSTNKGIGPAYTDKMARRGVKVQAFLNDNSEITNELKRMGVQFEYALSLYDQLIRSKVLFEGAQGILLDLNAGCYPYVSCGDSTLAGIYSSGFGFIAPQTVYGVVKAYTTKVGTGPFPTEYFGQEAETIRERGKEYGSVSGRPRRIGALDLPALLYAKKRGGLTDLILTKLDILNGEKEVKICHRYQKEPVSGADFFVAKPEYTILPGWQDARNLDEIWEFISMVQAFTDMPVKYISCGVEKDDLIEVDEELCYNPFWAMGTDYEEITEVDDIWPDDLYDGGKLYHSEE
jgi:adenylosuccinate synthase